MLTAESIRKMHEPTGFVPGQRPSNNLRKVSFGKTHQRVIDIFRGLGAFDIHDVMKNIPDKERSTLRKIMQDLDILGYIESTMVKNGNTQIRKAVVKKDAPN